MLGFYACNEVASLRAISDGAFCNKNSERHTILAYPDLHIAPWTEEELPERAHLPAPGAC